MCCFLTLDSFVTLFLNDIILLLGLKITFLFCPYYFEPGKTDFQLLVLKYYKIFFSPIDP